MSSEKRVVLYGTRSCSYCRRARELLATKQVPYTEYPIDRDPQRRAEMLERSRRTSVPQIFIDDRHIGGYDELSALERQGELDRLLAA